jgi:hypothetical protein
MRKFLAASLIGILASYSFAITDFNQYRNKGYEMVPADRATSYQVGVNEALVVSSASADQNASNNSSMDGFQNCRAISCDSAGIIKLGLRDNNGTESIMVMNMVGGVIYPIRNVQKVYKYYVGTTACTAQTFTEAGVLVVGIRLLR